MSMLPWLTFLVRVGLCAGLIVVIQMNARRVGGALWFLALLPAVHIIMSLAYRALSLMEPTTSRHFYGVLDVLDAALTMVASLFIVIGCALLRTPLRS